MEKLEDLKRLDAEAMSSIVGGEDAAWFGCGVAVGMAAFAAGFVTGGTAWFVGAAIAGPSCAAAGALELSS